MKAVSAKALYQILEQQSWQVKLITASHHIYAQENVETKLSIPVHSHRDLPIGTLKIIIKDAELTLKDFD